MARRALKGINWPAIAERINESDKHLYAALKSKSDQYLQRVMSYPEEPMKIDWNYYKKHIAVAGMVDKFQKEYESIKIPYPADNYTAAIDAEGQQAMELVKEFIEGSNQRIVQHRAEVERLKNLIPFDEMTLEDYAEAYPNDALHIDRPSIWPHDPNDQPGDKPEPLPQEDH